MPYGPGSDPVLEALSRVALPLRQGYWGINAKMASSALAT
ncbi:hypothetical protein BL107_04839, partial [Synechococcus sp. BL107]